MIYRCSARLTVKEVLIDLQSEEQGLPDIFGMGVEWGLVPAERREGEFLLRPIDGWQDDQRILAWLEREGYTMDRLSTVTGSQPGAARAE